MLNFGCVGVCILYLYIAIYVVESTQVDCNVRLSGAVNFPPRLIGDFKKKCGLESGNLAIKSGKSVYNDPKVSKLVRLINEWYAKNNYVGSGVKNILIEEGDKLHIICDELKVDKYHPLQVHTYTFGGSSKPVDTNLPNSFATLCDSKFVGTLDNKQNVSNNFILRKLGLIPGQTFRWDPSKWAAIESCGLFRGNSVVKLVRNPKDGTVTLHVFVIENPTKIIGPFLGNILNAYKEPVFGLKFQHINILNNGVIGTLCTSIGLSNENSGFETRPYKITASITNDIVESFVWLNNRLRQPCKVLSIKAFADNSKIGSIVKYNIKLSGQNGPRASLAAGLSSANAKLKSIKELQSVAEVKSNFKLLKCTIDTASTITGSAESGPWKIRYRGKFSINLPITKTISTALEGGVNSGIGTGETYELEVRGSNTPPMKKFNTSGDLNLLLCRHIPISLPASKEDSRSVQVGNGVIGLYLSATGGVRKLVKDNVDKVESAIITTLGIVAGINNARIFIGMPLFKVENNKTFDYTLKFDPKVTLDISVPINN